MYLKFNGKIPPTQSASYVDNFTQNFFTRIAHMPHLVAAETLDFFVKNSKFESQKSR